MGDSGHNRHGLKIGGCCAPFAGGDGSPCNTMWPGPRSTSVPSGVFIHPASSRLATIVMGRKLGDVPLLGETATHVTQRRLSHWVVGCALFSRGGWVLIEHKFAWPRPTSIPSGILVHPVSFGHNGSHWPKIGSCAPREGELGTHLTQCGLG